MTQGSLWTTEQMVLDVVVVVDVVYRPKVISFLMHIAKGKVKMQVSLICEVK